MNVLLLVATLSTLTITQQGLTSGSVPLGAERAPFLNVSLQASCSAPVTVRSLSVLHRGLGLASDIAGVYAMNGDTRITRVRSFDSSSHAVSLPFLRPLTIPACGSSTVQIDADIAPTAAAAGQHTLSISAADASGASVKLSSLLSSTVTAVPHSVGSVHLAFLPLVQAPTFGSSQTLARFQLSADGTHDQTVQSIVFTNGGSASDMDLRNLRVQNRKGDVLTGVQASMTGDHVRLTFDPSLTVQRNSTLLLELVGDVRASIRRTIRFSVDEPSDVEASPRAR